MIRRIVLTNFQKHSKYIIDLDPRITCLIGPSDAGKSAVVRALYWCCVNKPGGSDFIRHGTDAVSVKVYTKKHKIERIRSARTNEYRMNDRILKAFGLSNVPIEVVEVLNVGEDNFRLQLDPHFWFSETSGQVSQKLNEVVNLSLIDHALDHAASKVRSAKAEVEFHTDRANDAKANLERLEWVPRYLRRVEAVEQFESTHAKKTHRIAALQKIVARANICHRRLEIASNATLEAKKVVDLGRSAFSASRRARSLRALIAKVRETEQLTKLDFAQFRALSKMRSEGDRFTERVSSIETLVSDGLKLEEELCELKKKIQTEREKLTAWKVCPTCGTPIVKPGESSPSSPRIFTCAKRHHSVAPKKPTG